MVSRALEEWRGARAARLDELEDAHSKVDPKSGPGRRIGTGQLNQMLVVKLSAEWQGFNRDLYDDALDFVLGKLSAAGPPVVVELLRPRLTQQLQLDNRNATAKNLSKDYGRLGIPDLWEALRWHARDTPDRVDKLNQLMDVRNGIVHDDRAKLEGITVNLGTVRRWQNALDRLADSLDGYLAVYLARMFDGSPRPW